MMRIAPAASQDPSLLRAQLEHAERLVLVLETLYERAHPGDPALVWLTGRAAEVSVFVADVTEGWGAGEVTTARATDSIVRYLRTLHRALESWYGQDYAPSCCAPIGHDREGGARSGVRPAVPISRDTLPEDATRPGAPQLHVVSVH